MTTPPQLDSSLKTAPEILADVSYFAGLDRSALLVLERGCRSKTFHAGQIVFMEGDPCRDLCILESGRVTFSRVSAEGREHILKIFEKAGDTFCIPSAFSAGRYIVTIKATTVTRLRLLDIEAVNTVIREHPSIGLKLIATAGEHMSHLVALAQDLALKTTTARLARHLHDLTVQSGGGNLSIPRELMREEELASMLGTVRVNVARSLKNLVRAGAIELNRKFIRVLDSGALEHISQEK
jgi:CRP/FNR family transcriptional regulator